MKQLGFYINSKFCSGCKTCQVACKDKNNLENGIIWRRVYEVTGGDWKKEGESWVPGVISYNISMSCNHCNEPKCAEVCPTRAQHKTAGGIVEIDPDKCIGCRYCEWACPYGSPRYDSRAGVMTKCNLCSDHLRKDLQPACVSGCPMRVIEFGEIEELKAKFDGRAEIYPLASSDITDPNLLVNPHESAAGADADNSEIANREEVE